MELTLLGTVAVAAFIVVGAAVLLVVAFRRTIELRGALIQALRRIEMLEAAVAAGRPLEVAASPVETIAALAAEQPRLLTPPPTIEEIAAATGAEDRIDPPHLAVLAFGVLLAAFAALAAAQVRALSGQGGVFLAMLAGFLAVAAAEWRRRRDEAGGAQTSRLPSPAALSALLGLAVIFVALMYGRWMLAALPPPSAVFGVSVLATMAALLSLRFGVSLLAAALVCAAIAPAQSLVQADGAWGQYVFLFGFAALMLWISRRRQAPIWAWLGGLAALFWGVNAAIIGGSPFNVGVAGIYLAALAALGLLYAWPAAPNLPFPRFWATPWREPIAAGYLFTLAAATALAALLLAHPTPVALTGAALIALAAVAIAAAALRNGLWLASWLAALTCAVAIAFWPAESDGLIDAPGILIVAASLGLLFSLGGWAAMAGAKEPRPGASLAALAPALIFAAAFWRIGDFGGVQAWAAAALVIAGINTVSYLQLRRSRAEVAAPFAAGAALAFAAMLTAIAPPPYQPLGLAVSLPLIALVERWRNEPGLRFAAGMLCVLIFAGLFAPQIFIASAGPLWRIVILFAPAAAAALLASLLLARRDDPPIAAQGAFALASLLAATGATLSARHAFTGGAIGAPYASLAEAGLNTLIWLSAAIALAWRYGRRLTPPLFALESILAGAACLHALIVTGVLINPWWGLAPAPTAGLSGLNAIELAYLAPALLFVAYALLRRRQGLAPRAGVALSIGLLLAFLTLVLELRRLFHGPGAMADAAITQTEAWVYSGAALGFAALLLALGAARHMRAFHYISLALALAALGKMAFSDLGALNGLGRIGVFLLIAIAAGGVIFFYRRFVLPPDLFRPKSLADPNLVPPS